MKGLTGKQLGMAISPDRRSGNPADNYASILQRLRDALRDIEEIATILPEIENHRNYTAANQICQQFTIEKIEPILKELFPTEKEEGASLDDSILFNYEKMNGERIKLAASMLKFCSDYLLQAFPAGQWDYLQGRIQDLVTELTGVSNTFDKTKQLMYQINEYKEHVEHFEPITISSDQNVYVALCEYCRVYNSGNTLKDAIEKLEHTSKCKSRDDHSRLSPEKVNKWFKVVLPNSKKLYDLT